MKKERTNIFELRLSNNRHEIAYLEFPNRSKNTIERISKNIRLHDLIGKYDGPDIYLDFNLDGELIGVEVLTDNYDEDD